MRTMVVAGVRTQGASSRRETEPHISLGIASATHRSARTAPLAAVALVAWLLGCDTTPATTLLPNDGGSAPDGSTTERPVPFVPPSASLRRLTQAQYTHSLRDLFGESLRVPTALEPDVGLHGSTSIGASLSSISVRGAVLYEGAAYAIAEQVLRDPERRRAVVPCTPAAPDDAGCAALFVRSVGPRLWRRPLLDDEVSALTAIATRAGRTLMNASRSHEFALAAMLQSTDFLFRVELGVADLARPGERRVMGYEFASKLSFFLWDSTPDDALLAAAERGELDTPEGLETHVRRMLASPKIARGVRAFVTDWLKLGELDQLSKDPVTYPGFTPELGRWAREEVLRNVEDVVVARDRDVRDLLLSRETFVNRALASVYDVSLSATVTDPGGFERIVWPPAQQRRGFLGSVAFLALQAHASATSPTLRGRFVREQLLCEPIEPPPPTVSTTVPQRTERMRTMRERLAEHSQAPSCRFCHQQTDPIGLAFEHFDGIGRYRELDLGAPIDPSGVFDGTPWNTPSDLAMILRDDPRFTRCIVRRLFRHAWGVLETPAQQQEVERLEAGFAAQGYRLRTLMHDVATGDAFRRALPPER